jgi:hypothetical protein
MKFVSFIASIVFAATIYAQRPLVQLDVEPKDAEIGQSVTITVKANIQGDLEVDLPKAFESGYATMSSMQQEIDYSTGKVVTYFIHSQNGSFNRSGSFSVGPAYIRKGNKVFKSNVASVSVKKEDIPETTEQRFSYRQLVRPAFGVIQTTKRSVYEGEPIVLTAKIYARFSPTHLEGYESYTTLGSGERHELNEGSEQIAMKEERIGRTNYYSFSYDKQLIFPLEVGKLKVEPYKMLLMRGFESFSLTSSALSIDVKPLPKGAPSSFTGGVGEFKTSQQLSTTEVKQGEMITLTRTISGHGNLHLIDFPELKLPDALELYGDPEVKESFSFSSEGSKGKITQTYHLKALKAGNVQLPYFTLAYFDPEKAQYEETETTTKNLHITGDPTLATAGTSNTKGKTEETFHQANRSDAGNAGGSLFPNWIWIVLTGLFALISIKLFRERKSQKTVVSEPQAEPVPTFETTQATSPIIRIANARSALDKGDMKTFHTQTEKAVINALANSLKSAEQNRSVLLSHMEGHPNKPQLSKWFSDFDASRYGMGISGAEPKELLERAEQLIAAIQS